MGRRGGDVERVVRGVSLVLAESFKRSINAPSSSTADLIGETLRRVVLSATDLTGITTGTLIQFHHSPPPPPPPSQTSQSPSSSSVVYFSDDKDTNQVTDSPSVTDQEQEVDPTAPIAAEEQQHVVTHPSPPPSSSSSSSSSSSGGSDAASARQDSQSVPSIRDRRVRRRPRERRVPSTSFGRALGFAGLGAGLAWGTIQESAKRILYGQSTVSSSSSSSPLLSDQNAERLALALCRMRGAALKLGQMLSIQDESLVPPPVLAALDIVRQGADVMPRSQLNDVLDSELGHDWTKLLKSFNYEPLAAASIGQVHQAIMKDGLEVAIKIQYPGVADSIDSDIENVKRLLDYTNLIPKGLFIDRAMKVAKDELSRECDYELESRNQKRFRDLLSDIEGVYVPMVIDQMSSKKVLATELVSGIPIDKVAALSQEVRNYVGRKLLELTLKELFIFRFMQTDPNWSNFLYDKSTNMINLIDFGAAREYRKGFVDDYLRMVIACADRDKESIIEMSKRLGFLTGMESEVMLDAHVQASFIVGLPFSTSGAYDFRASNITSSIAHLGATMLKHRLTPPPDEAYSLHRKLSGAFLACIKLQVVVPCRDLLLQVHQQYRFSDENEEMAANSLS